MRVQFLSQEDPPKQGLVTLSSVIAWRSPWTEGAWQAAVHRITRSQTQLKQLSMHTCMDE